MINRYNYKTNEKYIKYLAMENLKAINNQILNKIDFVFENKQFLNFKDYCFDIFDLENDQLFINFSKEKINYCGSLNDLYKFFNYLDLIFINEKLDKIIKGINNNMLEVSEMDL